MDEELTRRHHDEKGPPLAQRRTDKYQQVIVGVGTEEKQEPEGSASSFPFLLYVHFLWFNINA